MSNTDFFRKNIKLYLFSIIGGIALAHFCFWIIDYLFSSNDFSKDLLSEYSYMPYRLLLFLILIIAPLLETFVFQFLMLKLPFILGIKPVNRNFITLFIVSSILFSLYHCYNIPYIIYAGIIGMFLNSLYMYAEYFRKYSVNGFLLVSIIHFFINLSYSFYIV